MGVVIVVVISDGLMRVEIRVALSDFFFCYFSTPALALGQPVTKCKLEILVGRVLLLSSGFAIFFFLTYPLRGGFLCVAAAAAPDQTHPFISWAHHIFLADMVTCVAWSGRTGVSSLLPTRQNVDTHGSHKAGSYVTSQAAVA